MYSAIFAALAFMLPTAAPLAGTKSEPAYTNTEIYSITLADAVDCDAEQPVAIQVRQTVQAMDYLTYDDAVDMFIYLEAGEGVCGKLADHATSLVTLAGADPTAFMAELGLANRPARTGSSRKGAHGRGNATGPGQFNILQNGSAPPASSTVKTSSDYR